MERSALRRRARLGALTALTTLVVASPAAAAKDPNAVSKKLRDGVTVRGMVQHLEALQDIADLNGGRRASGTPGFDASAAYVAERLRRAGLKVQTQTFDFPYFEETGPSSFRRTAPTDTTYTADNDYDVMDYSGSGTASGNVVPVDINTTDPAAATSGCEAGDFAGFPSGSIALIQRGVCTFGDKVANATHAGAAGVIIFNQGNSEGRTELFQGTLGGAATVPVVAVSFDLGKELAQAGTAATITTQTVNETRQTANVIGDLAAKNPSKAGKVVLLGAHLDSVTKGPGINDDGTGTATNLEIAETLARLKKPDNPVRFAFWGAEESGLLGSTHYVETLAPEDRAKIGLNLNFDMLGSPNFARLIYDGDGDPTGTAGPEGSAQIEQVFKSYFDSKGLATEPTAFDGRSDYGPFIDQGIPAGGLFSGAEEIKTPEQVALYGGTAGEAFDKCYHQACDTIDNVNRTGLDQLADGAAHATAVYAYAKPAPPRGHKAHNGEMRGEHAIG